MTLNTTFPSVPYSTSITGTDGVPRVLTGTVTFSLAETFPIAPSAISVTSSGTGINSSPGFSLVTLPSANAGDLLVAFVATDAPNPGGTAPITVADIISAGVTWTKFGAVHTSTFPSQNLEVWTATRPASALSGYSVEVDFSSNPDGAAVVVMAFSHVSATFSEEPLIAIEAPQPGGYAVITPIPCSATGMILAIDTSTYGIASAFAPFTSIAVAHQTGGSNGTNINVANYAPGAAGSFTALFNSEVNYAAAALVLKNG